MNQILQQNSESLKVHSVQVCPLCEGPRVRARFEVRHVLDDPAHSFALELGLSTATILECRECGFLFKNIQPPAAYVHKHYTNSGERYLESIAEEDEGIREDFRAARQLLRKGFPGGGSILDIGCASGFFLESLGNTWNRYGLELSSLAALRARERAGIIVHEGDIGSARFADNSFDVVSSFDVLEHLSKPMPTFSEVRRVLKPGGWFLMGTGDVGSFTARAAGSRWTYMCIPEHLSFFSSRSLRKALGRAEFSQTDFKRIHHGERNRAAATGWMRAVGKHWAVTLFGDDIRQLRFFRQKSGEFLVPYFFDHMICIAR
jgi:SAM-dependent methyltransferase